MDNTNTNNKLGMKWFVFYTQIRPWLSCVASIFLLTDFFKFSDIYLTHWWTLLYFLVSVAQPIVAIMAFVKAKGDYVAFVGFVKGALLFEAISLAYQQGVRQYIKGLNPIAVIFIVLILFVVMFFLWFKLNLKYFENRIPKEMKAETAETNDSSFGHLSSQNSSSKNVCNPADNNADIHICKKCGNMLPKDARFCNKCGAPNENGNNQSSETILSERKILYCRHCGYKLNDDSAFCSKCGTKVKNEVNS